MFKHAGITITVLGVLVALMGTGCRRHFCHHSRMTPEKLEKISGIIESKLDFDEAQKAKMKKLVKRISDEMPAFREKRETARDLMLKQFESDAFDKTEVSKTLQGFEKDVPKMRELMVSAAAEFHSILTPEQRKKVVEHMKKHKEKCKNNS